MQKLFKTRLFFQVVMASLIATLATVGIVAATTTIGTSINTGGTLTVTSTTATSTISTGGLTVGTNQFVVQQTSGNVGIGTVNPAAKLDVNGTFIAKYGAGAWTGSATSWYMGSLSYAAEGNAEKLKVEIFSGRAGSIGFTGTATYVVNSRPSLEVTREIHDGQLYNYTFKIYDNGTTGYDIVVGTAAGASTAFNYRVWKYDGTGTMNELMPTIGYNPGSFNDVTPVITDYFATIGGRVGIGTIAPLGKLGVLGNLAVGATYGAIAPPTSGMIIEGSVGIGTAAPAYKLDVTGNAHITTFVDAANFVATSTSVASTFAYRVGIGTTTPTTQLQVTTPTANATSTLTVGKASQNKGSCLELFDSAGTAVYAYVAAGGTTFTLSAVSCK